jgi:hypothetical protein
MHEEGSLGLGVIQLVFVVYALCLPKLNAYYYTYLMLLLMLLLTTTII